MKRVRKDDDEHSDGHRAGKEKRIDARDQAEDEKDRSGELGVRGDVTEKDGDVVAGEVGGERGNAAVAEDLRVPVRQEDQPGSNSQHERGDVNGPFAHVASIVGTTSLFVSIYLATFIAAGYVARITGMRWFYWPGLVAATVATLATVAIIEGGRWNIGVVVPAQYAARDFAIGIVFAAILIGIADLIVLATTSMRHTRGSGFPFAELWIVYVPAAIHEEVLFRGYLFQKIRRWSRPAAIGISSVIFAALHGSNSGINTIAIVNLLLAGVFLCLAYERYERLWLPIGIHLGWNLASGPILGYGVSGFAPEASVLRIAGGGPSWLTGGAFGIEGSVTATAVEGIGIAILFLTREIKH